MYILKGEVMKRWMVVCLFNKLLCFGCLCVICAIQASETNENVWNGDLETVLVLCGKQTIVGGL